MENLDTRMKSFVKNLNDNLKDHKTQYLQIGAGVDSSKYESFLDHKCTFHVNNKDTRTAIGGAYTYKFTPTNIGTVIKVSCACGLEDDITDYLSW